MCGQVCKQGTLGSVWIATVMKQMRLGYTVKEGTQTW